MRVKISFRYVKKGKCTTLQLFLLKQQIEFDADLYTRLLIVSKLEALTLAVETQAETLTQR